MNPAPARRGSWRTVLKHALILSRERGNLYAYQVTFLCPASGIERDTVRQRGCSVLAFANMNERLITYTELRRRLSLSRVKIWEMVRDGEFPPPIRIGRAVRFVVSDIDGWIADHVSAQANGDSGASDDADTR